MTPTSLRRSAPCSMLRSLPHSVSRPWVSRPFAVAALAALAALGGCSGVPSTQRVLDAITPYRVEVVQGNVVTSEQMAVVKPGMTRAQVRDVLGSPLLTDAFHADRWDYVFTIRRRGTQPQARSIVLTFDKDLLAKIEAPDLPSEREFVLSIDTFKSNRDAGTLALTDAQREALPLPPKPAPASVEPTVAPRSYPPLEPQS